ncbi:Protein CBG27806 [Caenorhabditis briggsae]|uniref:Protein CBG27806 n=1 Tax=Caenorhabditis briggsae TaxID=6238 RepID=B6IK88_CAEBR|nr:Protein CBG27806 [Caenorhabditis briggsae]CAS00318.1 Protein CBG27806 [Caenorhabditis briggsae]
MAQVVREDAKFNPDNPRKLGYFICQMRELFLESNPNLTGNEQDRMHTILRSIVKASIHDTAKFIDDINSEVYHTKQESIESMHEFRRELQHFIERLEKKTHKNFNFTHEMYRLRVMFLDLKCAISIKKNEFLDLHETYNKQRSRIICDSWKTDIEYKGHIRRSEHFQTEVWIMLKSLKTQF